MVLKFLAEAVENPANQHRIGDAARLLGGSCTATPDGHLIAVENSPLARSIYGRPALRGLATLALGHERRGVPRALLASADETVAIPTASRTVTTLNVAAAAAVAGWYVLRGCGPQAIAAHPDRRHPAVLLSGDDHVEVGSSLRSAAALGWREVFLDDRSAAWFDGPSALRRESRAAARRHKNPLHVRRAAPGLAGGFEEVVVVSPAGPGRAITRQPLARGRRQLVVIGAGPEQVAALPTGRLRVATLGLHELGCAPPLRLVASIALAEIARQVGRPPPGRRPPPGGPLPGTRAAIYERELKLVADGELLVVDPAVLLTY